MTDMAQQLLALKAEIYAVDKKADKALHDIQSHEKLCAERMQLISQSVSDLKSSISVLINNQTNMLVKLTEATSQVKGADKTVKIAFGVIGAVGTIIGMISYFRV